MMLQAAFEPTQCFGQVLRHKLSETLIQLERVKTRDIAVSILNRGISIKSAR